MDVEPIQGVYIPPGIEININLIQYPVFISLMLKKVQVQEKNQVRCYLFFLLMTFLLHRTHLHFIFHTQMNKDQHRTLYLLWFMVTLHDMTLLSSYILLNYKLFNKVKTILVHSCLQNKRALSCFCTSFNLMMFCIAWKEQQELQLQPWGSGTPDMFVILLLQI